MIANLSGKSPQNLQQRKNPNTIKGSKSWLRGLVQILKMARSPKRRRRK